MLFSRKALQASAFFIVSFTLSVSASERCVPAGKASPVKISKVVDGDTVRTTDGRSLRFVGVNTPELNSERGDPEPYARDAKRAVESWLSRGSLSWVPAIDSRDRYGRHLGYLIIDDQTIAQRLIEAGLGWAVAVAPNIQLADCLLSQESEARQQQLGVWQSSPISAAKLSKGGFAVIRGVITRVDTTQTDVYIEIDDHLVIKISLEQLQKENYSGLAESLGRSIEARGWVIDRASFTKKRPKYKRFLLPLSSLAAFDLQ